MKNKTIAKAIGAGISISLLTALFESSLSYNAIDNLYTLAGLILLVFGAWGAVRLWKSAE